MARTARAKAFLVPSPDPSIRIGIGRVLRAHGIRGELGVAVDLGDPGLLLGRVFLRRAGVETPHTVLDFRRHHGNLLLRLEGVDDRTTAEALRGSELLMERAKLPPPNEDEIYLDDLIGLLVIYDKDGQATELGRIEAVDDRAGTEIWQIRTADGREVLFPAADELVRRIDLAAGRTEIFPPPGLIELYLGE